MSVKILKICSESSRYANSNAAINQSGTLRVVFKNSFLDGEINLNYRNRGLNDGVIHRLS